MSAPSSSLEELLTLPTNKNDKNSIESLEITPTAGFVFKITSGDAKSNNVLYINTCSHENVGEPHVKSIKDENGETIEGLNVPTSIGEKRIIDIKEKSFDYYDVIVNPSVINDCNTDETGKYRDFICQLAVESIEKKYKVQLNHQYKLLKSTSYIGEIKAHHIRKPTVKPTITELTSTPSSSISEPKIKEILSKTNKITKDSIHFTHTVSLITHDDAVEDRVIVDSLYTPPCILQKSYNTQSGSNILTIRNDIKAVEFIGIFKRSELSPLDIEVKVSAYKLQVQSLCHRSYQSAILLFIICVCV